MGLLFLLDKDQYVNGRVSVVQGDRWTLDGKVVNRVGGVDLPVDLSGASVSGFFPGTDGVTDVIEAEVTNDEEGRIRCTVLEAESAELETSEAGIPMWIAINDQADPAGLQSLRTPNSDLFILEPQDFDPS